MGELENDFLVDLEQMDRERFAPGMYDNIDNARYHKAFGISKSGLDKIDRSPFHYLYSLTHPTEQTKAMRIGSALHTAVLEPHLFDNEFILNEGHDRRSNAGKVAHEAFLARAKNKTILSADEFETVEAMRTAINKHKGASTLLSNGWAEQSFFCELTDFDVMCKVRPDYRKITKIGRHVLIDVKTTEDAGKDEFIRTIIKRRYEVQAAFYMDVVSEVTGIPVDAFIFIAVEKQPPHGVALYQVDWHTVISGKIKYSRNLAEYKKCLYGKYWPCYSNDAIRITLPGYALE